MAEDRVAAARGNSQANIQKLFAEANVAYPPSEIFLRAFKHEGELELWAGDGQGPLTKIRTYPVCAPSGGPGPKKREGDLQVPEGFYEVDRFNPKSSFHLSLGIDYPNASDRARSDGKARLGGDIFIHGRCVTIGCLPLEDGPIEELYVIALDAKVHGKKRAKVHLFPARLDDEGFNALVERTKPDASLTAFWKELQAGYLAFEESRKVPRIQVDPKTGRYLVQARR